MTGTLFLTGHHSFLYFLFFPIEWFPFPPPPIPGWIIWPRALIPVLWGESGNLKCEAVEAAVMCGRRTPEAAPISDPSSASAESTNDEEVVSGERLDLKILFGSQFCSALLHWNILINWKSLMLKGHDYDVHDDGCHGPLLNYSKLRR